ncbi:MAG: FtsW/RodA/SpoVE family cell cycle protein [Oscillospiraceae bacterium]|nr:FtsW/RodA/SpoVE family cell cycle protein [Oscillospiraceae bacterium]
MDIIRDILYRINEFTAGLDGGLSSYATMMIRFILPVLAIIILVRCSHSLFRERSESELWGQLKFPNGTILDMFSWENIIGRAKSSDVFSDYPTISRNHAALIRDDKANWKVYDIESKTGVIVNGKKIEGDIGVPVNSGDTIELGGIPLTFIAADNTDEYEQAVSRTKPGRYYKQRVTIAYLTLFQMFLALQLYIALDEQFSSAVIYSFLALIILTWSCYIITRILKRVAFEIETIGFFLTTIGLSVTASSVPSDIMTQIMFIVLGVIGFFTIGWFLRDLDRIKKFRRPIAIIGPLLLAITLVLGTNRFGATRWIVIGGISVQPVEFVKIAIIFAGAATLERLFKRRNIFAFVGLMGVCLGLLALMVDFGSAMIFFVAYLVIAFLRSGDFTTIVLSVAGAGFAGFIALTSRPHIIGRFASWGRAWEYVDTAGGFQQTRAMTAAASGGLFGVGAGNGWFQNIFAADSDLVFAMVSEELGLIVAMIAVIAILIYAVYTVRYADEARSSFYVIAACAMSAMMVFQMMLNVLGSMDILPFTGVTFPFVSRGGTSLVASWGMLAFFKAADTRQNASFVVKAPKRPKFSGGGSIIYKNEYDEEYIGENDEGNYDLSWDDNQEPQSGVNQTYEWGDPDEKFWENLDDSFWEGGNDR